VKSVLSSTEMISYSKCMKPRRTAPRLPAGEYVKVKRDKDRVVAMVRCPQGRGTSSTYITYSLGVSFRWRSQLELG
jgi:hypothetical protein